MKRSYTLRSIAGSIALLGLVTTPSRYYVEADSAANGLMFTVAGNGSPGYNGDGIPAVDASLYHPDALAIDSVGNLYIAEWEGQRVRRVNSATGVITTVAGTGLYSYNGDGIPAENASLRYPRDVALDGAGNVYIADSANNRIRKVDAVTGIISTVAGSGDYGYNGDGISASNASLRNPFSVAVDPSGNLYIADFLSFRIRRVDSATGLISTVAGNGSPGFSGDGGPATAAQLYYPGRVRLDSQGNLYISDTDNHRIRRVDVGTGQITTVAGGGSGGDGGLATAATLGFPYGTTLDDAGNLYIADRDNHRVRKVDAATGIISTVAGSDGAPYTYNGEGVPALEAKINGPYDVVFDSAGTLYIADFYNHRVRKVDLDLQPVADDQAPTVTCATVDGIWHGTDVSLTCTASDAGSGLLDASDAGFSLTTSVAMGVETANAQTNSRTVCDVAGNCTTVGPIGGNMVDRRPPSITISGPTAGPFLLGQLVASTFGCLDGGSGLSTCDGPAATGSPIYTGAVGPHTFSVTATDTAGNATESAMTYVVAYGQCVLFDQTKASKAGSTVPIKLQLCDAASTNVSDASVALVATAIYLVSTNAPGQLSDSGSANPDNQFRFADGSYIFNLSLKGFEQGPYALAFKAGNDLTAHVVQFQVK